MDDLNYELDQEVDKYELHKEWAKQSAMSFTYKKEYLYLKKISQQAHEKVKVTRSELIRAANSDPEKCCNKAKPTAGDIEAYYRNHKDHKKAKEEHIEAEYQMDMAEAAMEEISFTRKKAIENLSFLWSKGYYTDPNLPKMFEEKVNDCACKTSPGMQRKKPRKKEKGD